MELSNKVPTAVISAVTAMLQPYAPELSPKSLIEMIKGYGDEPKGNVNIPESPMTRKDVAALLGVSLNSVNHYVKQGRLSAVKISKRLVRIDPQSVRSMLNFNHAEA